MSQVAASSAIFTGLCNGKSVTAVPSRIRVVRCAAAASTISGEARTENARLKCSSPSQTVLSPSDLDLVLAATELVDAKPGQVILTEGTPGDGMYVVLEGEVEIFLPQRSGTGLRRPSRVGLNRLGPGRCFGEYGALDDLPSSASAASTNAAKLAFVPTAKFRR